MNRKKKWLLTLGILLAVALVSGISIYAATTYGTASDPLVTMSYVNKVKTDIVSQAKTYTDSAAAELEGSLDTLLDSYAATVESKLNSSSAVSKTDVFTTVTLSSGQSLLCSAGAEILPRSGSAVASGQISDTTSGTSVSSGSTLTGNHMYVTVTDDTGIKASGGSVVVMVRGDYTVR